MTTADERKEKICLLNVGEHPWVNHLTCINYGDAVLTSLDKLYRAKDGGALKLQEPLSEPLVKRILAAAPESVRIRLEFAELLRDQALVDF